MNKFYGVIGYAEHVDDATGLVDETIIERPYYGDVKFMSRRLANDGQINDDISINNEISIIADPYAYSNFANIRYVEWMGTKWKVTNITVEYPRLTLSIGGVYN